MYLSRIYSDRKWVIFCFVSLLVLVIFVLVVFFGIYLFSYDEDVLQFDVMVVVKFEELIDLFVEDEIKKLL